MLYSQHFIFLVTYEWALKATVFVPGKPFQLSVMQHSNIWRQLLDFEESGLLRLQPLVLYSQHFIFLVTDEWVKLATVFVPGKPFQPSVMQLAFWRSC